MNLENQPLFGQQPFHLGQCVKNELSRQGRTITWLAGEVHCTRENLYKIFRKPWMNTDMLFKISKALEHDFFKDCSVRFNSDRRNAAGKGGTR